jgi:hypothetical protein
MMNPDRFYYLDNNMVFSDDQVFIPTSNVACSRVVGDKDKKEGS